MEQEEQTQQEYYRTIERNILDDKMMVSAINVMTDLDKWDFMRTYTLPKNQGYIFCENEEIKNIMSKIIVSNPSHSATSIAITMRTLKFIADYGSPTLNYLRRRNFLFFLENLKQSNIEILHPEIWREICKFL